MFHTDCCLILGWYSYNGFEIMYSSHTQHNSDDLNHNGQDDSNSTEYTESSSKSIDTEHSELFAIMSNVKYMLWGHANIVLFRPQLFILYFCVLKSGWYTCMLLKVEPIRMWLSLWLQRSIPTLTCRKTSAKAYTFELSSNFLWSAIFA